MTTTLGRQVFLNLPVRDVQRSIDFFKLIGFTFDERFAEERSACVVVNDSTRVVLIDARRFGDFTDLAPCDTHTHAEVIVSFTVESPAAVDELVQAAITAGARPALQPMRRGSMYLWSFHDPDGHQWEVVHLGEGSARAASAGAAAAAG